MTAPAPRKAPRRQSDKARILAALKAFKAKSDAEGPSNCEFGQGWDQGFIAAIQIVEKFK